MKKRLRNIFLKAWLTSYLLVPTAFGMIPVMPLTQESAAAPAPEQPVQAPVLVDTAQAPTGQASAAPTAPIVTPAGAAPEPPKQPIVTAPAVTETVIVPVITPPVVIVADTQNAQQQAILPQKPPANNFEDIKDEHKKEIYLNFENTDLSSFIDYIAEVKKLNVIPDRTLEGAKISLTIREPLSIDGAWNVFLTVLDMAGFSIIQAGDVYKILPKDKKLMQPLPAYINVPYQTLPDSDETVRYVMFLTNIQVDAIRPVLESMLSSPSALHEQKDMNAFIIVDKSFNVKAAAKLLFELDQMGLPENVTVLRLKRTNAVDVKNLIDGLKSKPDINPLARLLGKVSEGGVEYFSPTTRIIPEERTNSLILLGRSESIDKIVNFITTKIDTEIKEAESPLHIFELQNIDAVQVKDILKQVTAVPDSVTGQAAGKFGSIRGGVKYFKPMTFEVDKDGNRLIISCTDKQDWRLLKKTIQDLDKPQPQVAIESLVVRVTVNDTSELGGALRNKKHGQIGKNIDFQSPSPTGSPVLEQGVSQPSGSSNVSLLGNMLQEISAKVGQTALTFGAPGNIWAYFTALKAITNASILSQPFLTVANKTKATIDVGETRRIVSETQAASGSSSEVSSFEDAKASVKLDILPHINLDGIIRLQMELNIEDFIDNDANQKTIKKVMTDVTVADGQVLVMGGFVQTKIIETKIKTPILGDIPILGWFFKNQRRERTKEYLFIFLAPTIIKPRQMPGMELYTKMKLHEATDDIEESVETRRVMDPIHNWFFNPDQENYSHKVIDFANARYQPTTVDIKNDPYYRSQTLQEEDDAERAYAKSLAMAPSVVEQMVQEPKADPIKQPEQAPVAQGPVEQKAAVASAGPADIVITPAPQQSVIVNTAPVMVTVEPKKTEQMKLADQSIDQQRAALKNILADDNDTFVIEPRLQPETDKRAAMKKTLSDEPKQERVKTETIVVDPGKRNVLKNFLSSSPALARRGNHSAIERRKVAA